MLFEPMDKWSFRSCGRAGNAFGSRSTNAPTAQENLPHQSFQIRRRFRNDRRARDGARVAARVV
jgi:hypothetical protein